MKKAKPKTRPKAGRAAAPPKTIDQYLARVPQPARAMLEEMRAVIRAAVPPEATETISYRIPAFRHHEILVWFAGFRDHCSLFPKASVIERFRKELEGYTTSKGTIHFPLDKPLPVALVRKIVEARVAETAHKKRG